MHWFFITQDNCLFFNLEISECNLLLLTYIIIMYTFSVHSSPYLINTTLYVITQYCIYTYTICHYTSNNSASNHN